MTGKNRKERIIITKFKSVALGIPVNNLKKSAK